MIAMMTVMSRVLFILAFISSFWCLALIRSNLKDWGFSKAT